VKRKAAAVVFLAVLAVAAALGARATPGERTAAPHHEGRSSSTSTLDA
jgi:hypothetical protein